MIERWMAAALALAGVAGISPARAEDTATLNCVSEALDPAVAKKLSQGLGAVVTGDEDVGTEADYAALGEAAGLCGDHHDWSDEATNKAILFVVADLGIQGTLPLMKEAGIDPDAAISTMAGLPDSDLAMIVGKSESDEIGEMVLAAAVKAGLPVETERQQTLIGVLASYVAQKADALRVFSAQ